MGYIESKDIRSDYDVVVVGSGAAGGQSAYTLTMEGVRVLMLEAGRNYDPRSETPMFNSSQQAPLRGVATPDKQYGYYDATVDGGWDVPGEPYQTASKGKNEFRWWRARMLGGRTNHWGRISLRNGPYDFKPRSRDGLGFDWPISYEEIAPYYDKVEALIGVYGSNEGVENSPDSPEGILLPPPKARAAELLFHKAGKRLGIPVIPVHRAVLSERLDAKRLSRFIHSQNPEAAGILEQEMKMRAPCFWATPCVRGCSIKATYQSPIVHLPPALATGRLDILTGAMALEIEVDDTGKPKGVVFVDKATGMQHVARGRAIVLGASSLESVRLMLNSRSRHHPQGIGNSSGLLGKYIMDTVGTVLRGQVPLLENLPPHNEDGAGGAHVYAPWTRYRDQAAGILDFPRGYYIGMGRSRGVPSVLSFGSLLDHASASFGEALKNDARRFYGSFVTYSARGEMIPNENCFAELSSDQTDQWGLPTLKFHWQWSEHEYRQAAHMQQTFAELITEMGGSFNSNHVDPTGRRAIFNAGAIIHELGGAMMGSSPRSSVTNKYSQCWDAPNLFLADGATFCSNAFKNPTLTIMALAWRACDQIVARSRRGEL
jgi:choline dehydrogenase-like flavoprotein